MSNQGSEGSFGGQSSGSQSGSADSNGSSIAGGGNAGGGMSGQPIGGNDSNTGTGTTLTAGYTPPSSSQRTTSNAGGSTVGSDQTSGGSSGTSGGEGFIGSQGTGSDEYLREGGTSGRTTDSSGAEETTDFANQGRGATEGQNEDIETGQGRSDDSDIEQP
jgi:hypothetical protein